MPRVHGQLNLVTEQPERITEAHVRAPETRALGSGVVTGSPDRVRVEAGVFDAVLAPGPCVVTLVSLGVPVQHLRLVVPEGDVSLRAAFEAGLAADAGDRSVLERLAGEAAGALEAAEAATRAAASSAESAAGSAAGAAASESAAEAAAASAGRSATEASTHADRAESVAESVQWDGYRLTVAGKTSPSLRGPKGDPGEAGGVRGVAINGDGTDPQAEGMHSLALGWDAVGRSPYSAAVGAGSRAGGAGAVAVGYGSQAGGDYSAAVGYASRATTTATTAIGPGHEITTPGETHIGVPKEIAEDLGVPSSRVVLHGTAETTEPATKPAHLASKGMVDEVRALVETRAVVKQVTTPPSRYEPGVLYVIPE